MNIFFYIFVLLPLLEIAGFIVIGGKIGLGASLLWLIGAGMLGSWVLRGRGGIWARVQTADDDLFMVEGMFDALCLLVAGLLLVFPGFISDFLALPLLVPAVRGLIFRRLQKNPDGIIRRHVRIPVGVGFGIRDPESARKLSECADAVVIGSKIIETMEAAVQSARAEGASAGQSDARAIEAAASWLAGIRAVLG